MDKGILTTVITGIFSLFTALGSVWLKDLLERRRLTTAQKPTEEEARHPPPVLVPLWSWKRPLLVFFGAFALGLVTRALRPLFAHGIHWESVIAIFVLAAVSLWLAIDHRRGGRRFWPFELEVLALWLAWASGWTAVHGSAWSDLIAVAVLWWLGCAAVGGLIAVTGKQKVGT
jgi:hypothetical protein